MQFTVKLSEKVFYLGANDRRTHLFENQYPIPNGVAYNSYLIMDEKVALVDTIEKHHVENYMQKIEKILDGRKIDYLIINHMEPDHSGGIGEIVAKYPDVQIVGNKMTFSLVERFFGITENQYLVKEGNEIDLGHHKLKFFMTPWIHWPETMMTYCQTEKILFSGDAFGSFGTLDGGIFDDELNLDLYRDEMRRYYANIVGKYNDKVKTALGKFEGLEFKLIASTHGPIWRSHIPELLETYTKWVNEEADPGVVIIFGSMYGRTEGIADFIARKMAEKA